MGGRGGISRGKRIAKARRAMHAAAARPSSSVGNRALTAVAKAVTSAAKEAHSVFQSAKAGAAAACGQAAKVWETGRNSAKAENEKPAQLFDKAARDASRVKLGTEAGPPVTKSAGNMKEDKFVKEGEVKVGVGIVFLAKSKDILHFGDDDNHLNIAHAEGNVGTGYEYDPAKHEKSFNVVKLEGKVALVDVQLTKKIAKGLLEGTVKGEAVSASASLTPLSVVVAPNTAQIKGEAGAEANLVKVSASGQVNITPKTIYDNTVGSLVGFFSPGSEFASAPEILDHGIVVGAAGEAGIGAAAKATYEAGVKDGVLGASAGAKLGLGPMAGINIFLGIK